MLTIDHTGKVVLIVGAGTGIGAAIARGFNVVDWLPLAHKGRCYEFSNWLYHREDVARRHPISRGCLRLASWIGTITGR